MNSTHDSTHSRVQDLQRDTAAARAEAGTTGWEDAVRLQRWAEADHTDFYVLASEMVATLQGLEDLAGVLRRQVAGYGQGRRLYDDTRQVDPAVRVADAIAELGGLITYLQAAQSPANRFFSAISHIGVEDPDTTCSATVPTDTGHCDTAPCTTVVSGAEPSTVGEVSS